MQARTFQIGDIVKLVSGGPKMVLTAPRPLKGGQVGFYCQWFDKHGVHHAETFEPRFLTLIQTVETDRSNHFLEAPIVKRSRLRPTRQQVKQL